MDMDSGLRVWEEDGESSIAPFISNRLASLPTISLSLISREASPTVSTHLAMKRLLGVFHR